MKLYDSIDAMLELFERRREKTKKKINIEHKNIVHNSRKNETGKEGKVCLTRWTLLYFVIRKR